MDDEKPQDRGRLRLHRPTFRGSAVGWGISAVVWLSCFVGSGLGMMREGSPGVLGVLFLVALGLASGVCVTGTVSTIRHPRPGPPARDAP
jgi:hypothetical protein